MTLRTPFTELFVVEHPIALAPMGGSAGGALAAAVSNGGGLGLVGGGRGDWAWLEGELALAVEGTDKPWGVGFLSWSTDVSVVERALTYSPHAVMLSFGDPEPLAEPVQDAGVPLIVQVTNVAEAHQALDAGADVLVAQGSEAGGHGGRRATLPFVPVVADLAAPTPVLAAGGIADGRGLAAALVLGAAGALIGTRFQASVEALVAPEVAKAIIDGRGEDTERSRVLDIAQGAAWPQRYTARTLPNAFLDRWREREDELQPTRTPKPNTARQLIKETCQPSPSGPAKPSTSSPTSHPLPTWSPSSPPKHTRPSSTQCRTPEPTDIPNRPAEGGSRSVPDAGPDDTGSCLEDATS